MTIYRDIYEQHYGMIPVDNQGRTFEIHHKDGDRSNNDISNMIALSISDHFDIHYKQGDWNACLAISMRMRLSSEEISKMQSEIGRLSALKRIEEGTHNFLGNSYRRGKKHSEETKKKIREKRASQIVSKETYAKAAKSRTGKKRTEETKQLMSLRAKNREIVSCPHCGKTGHKPQMIQWHFVNCKENK